MTDPVLHFAQGWQCVLDDLNGAGRRWVVSPWMTPSEEAFYWRPGDRLLIRGKAKDFVQGSSSLKSLQDAFAQGVDVRRCHDLHAKLYVIEQNGHSRAWLGSANFTQSGFRGASHNVEAMAGPFSFQGRLAESVNKLWQRASKVTLPEIKTEIEAFEVRQQELLELARTNVLVLRVSFKYGQGHCGLRPEWLGIDPKRAPWNTVTFPSVDYFSGGSEMVKAWRNLKNRELRALQKLGLVRIEGSLGDGFYVLDYSRRAQVQAILETTRAKLRDKVRKDVSGDLPGLRQNFEARFGEVFKRFKVQAGQDLRYELSKIDDAQVIAAAVKLFSAYVDSDPANLGYSFFIPIHDPAGAASGVASAAESLLSQPQLKW